MEEIIKHINKTNASYRDLGSGNANNTDLFLDAEFYSFFENTGDYITVRFSKENLTKAILFIASILPRKYDNSSIHKNVYFSTKFVYEQIDLLNSFFLVDGKEVEYKEQQWIIRKDITKSNGQLDDRFYFRNLIEEFTYTNKMGQIQRAKFTIRNYLAGGFSDLHIKKSEDGVYDILITNVIEPYNDGKEDDIESTVDNTQNDFDTSIKQIIFYGAPGTGKSYEINRLTKDKHVIRTTFHPDSDYSTFVGAYKPTSIDVPVRDVTGKIIIENGEKVTEKRIVYEFVEQAFLQAYIKAWKSYADCEEGGTPSEQYLVIEEINRGNCAQIFGDLFQLLDRNSFGFSDYPIVADSDMRRQLAKAFKDLTIADAEIINNLYDKDVVNNVLNGTVLLLPNNLYIWATMNTSDQSLFPIDSAFKRRWDWKYIPISEGVNNNGVKLGYKLVVAGKEYDWWKFLERINYEIDEQTKSEDKKLGYFFCKAQDGVINAETFVSKVLFYLWNDVFKDQDVSSIFSDGDEELTFCKFYGTDSYGKSVIKEDKIEVLLNNLGIVPISSSSENEELDNNIDVNNPEEETE